MTKSAPMKPAYAWAVVGKDGTLCAARYGTKAIWTWREGAEGDCLPNGQRVARVRITEVKERAK